MKLLFIQYIRNLPFVNENFSNVKDSALDLLMRQS